MVEEHVNIDLQPASPPKGLLLWFFRLPVWFYRMKIGWLFGSRFMWFEHIGRKSGKRYETVIEVIRKDVEAGEYFVASGYGATAQWYQNLKLRPVTSVQVGFRKFIADVFFLDEAGSISEIKSYAERYPMLIKELVRVIGYKITGTPAEIEALGKLIPVVKFVARIPG